MRVLVRYYGYRNDKVNLEIYTRKMIKMIDDQVKKLSTFADDAVKDKNLVRAQLLLDQIKSLNPSLDKLNDVYRKIDALEHAQKEKS